jgi:hypothetical protein
MKKIALAALVALAACGTNTTNQTPQERFANAPPPSAMLNRGLVMADGPPALCGVTGMPPCQDDAHAPHAAYMARDVGGANSGMCNNCHVGFMLDWFGEEFDAAGNRRPAFIAPTPGNPNPPKPTFNGWGSPGATGVYNCSNVACHGVPEHTYTSTFQGGDGTPETKTVTIPASYATTPVWGETGKLCTACHDPSPPGPWHGTHANNSFPGANECSTCHPNVTGTVATGLGILDPSKHGDGIAEVQAQFRPRCFGCH